MLRKLAMGDAPGESRIYYEASGGSNSLFPQRYAGETYDDADMETVTVSTIDLYCQEHGIEHVDFIKMDIEGYEMAAISGAETMLRGGKIDVIQFEYSYVFLDAGTSLKRLMDYVHGVNSAYDFFKIYPDGLRPVAAYAHAFDNFKTQNWALIKRGCVNQAHVLR